MRFLARIFVNTFIWFPIAVTLAFLLIPIALFSALIDYAEGDAKKDYKAEI